MIYRGDPDDMDRGLADIDDTLKEQGADPAVRADLIDRLRANLLAPADEPGGGNELLAILLQLGQIGEAYERRVGNDAGADWMARYMAGFLIWLDLPDDLKDLAGGPNLADPDNPSRSEGDGP